MKVYLAGGMHSDWQDIVKGACPLIEFVDPRDHNIDHPGMYTPWDKHAIRNCDVLFAYLEKDNPSGMGMAYEVGYANGLGKTVVFVDAKQDEYAAILRFAADVCFLSLEAGVYFLLALDKAE